MNILPSNVVVAKPAKPRKWSHPLKTSEIVAGLGLDRSANNVHIRYWNSPPKNLTHMGVLVLHWYGNMSERDGGSFFGLGVQLCPPGWRKRLNKVVVAEVLPVLKQWMGTVPRSPYNTQVDVQYIAYKFRSPEQWTLEVVENWWYTAHRRSLLVRPLNLEDENAIH